ncbi:hypothetical protein D9757_000327 [Collybiopsis confluens]|uniref:Uncharacterized protein n=1 Tax=Collybiopsis confluens TaxID=2823264 RepID=A0A8H5I233_9AGAR|nr:hypothetical protein D9757_000327 [Collybiopsis confluens]
MDGAAAERAGSPPAHQPVQRRRLKWLSQTRRQVLRPQAGSRTWISSRYSFKYTAEIMANRSLREAVPSQLQYICGPKSSSVFDSSFPFFHSLRSASSLCFCFLTSARLEQASEGYCRSFVADSIQWSIPSRNGRANRKHRSWNPCRADNISGVEYVAFALWSPYSSGNCTIKKSTAAPNFRQFYNCFYDSWNFVQLAVCNFSFSLSVRDIDGWASISAYAGKTSGPEPSYYLCLMQASLLYGMPAITSLAAFFLVLQMFLVIRAAYYKREYREQNHVVRLWMMMILPYAAWVTSIVVTAFVGAAEPTHVSRDRRFFYCSVKSDTLTDTLTLFSAAVLFATLVLEVWTIVLFYKRWNSIERGSSGMFTAAELNLPARILSFGVYLLVAMSLSLLSIKSPESPAPDLMIASAATVLILIFGTQPDIIRALSFWKKEAVSRDTDSDITVVNIVPHPYKPKY